MPWNSSYKQWKLPCGCWEFNGALLSEQPLLLLLTHLSNPIDVFPKKGNKFGIKGRGVGSRKSWRRKVAMIKTHVWNSQRTNKIEKISFTWYCKDFLKDIYHIYFSQISRRFETIYLSFINNTSPSSLFQKTDSANWYIFSCFCLCGQYLAKSETWYSSEFMS